MARKRDYIRASRFIDEPDYERENRIKIHRKQQRRRKRRKEREQQEVERLSKRYERTYWYAEHQPEQLELKARRLRIEFKDQFVSPPTDPDHLRLQQHLKDFLQENGQ